MTRKDLIILFTLAAVQFTHILDGMIMMPMAPGIRQAFGISTQEFGFLVSSYGLAAFVSAIVATFWMDAFDRKKVLAVLYVGFILGTLSCALAPTYPLLLLARTFTGFFGGIAGAVILSIVGDVIAPERRAQGMGVLMTGFALASVAGVPAGIFLSEHFSWHAPFLFICIIGAPVMLLILTVIPPVNMHLKTGGQRASGLEIYRIVGNSPNLMRALGLSFTNVASHAAIIPFISDYFVNNLGFHMNREIIFMYIIGGLLSTVTSPVTGRLADKYGRLPVFMILTVLACIPIYIVSNMVVPSLALLLVTGGMFFIFSGGRMIPTQAIVTSTVPPQLRGRFMSLISAFQQLSFGLTTVVGGLIIVNDDAGKLQNYPIVGYIGIALALVSMVLAWGVKPIVEVPREVN